MDRNHAQIFAKQVQSFKRKFKVSNTELGKIIGCSDQWFSEFLNNEVDKSPWAKTFKLLEFLSMKSGVAPIDFLPARYRNPIKPE